MKTIEIRKDLLPYKFDIRLKDTLYTFLVKYNYAFDYFTVDLSIEGEEIINGEKVVYAKPLFDDYSHLNVPLGIIPIDLSDNAQRVGYNVLEDQVMLFWVGEFY
jgi:hypothetical protein